MTGATVNCASTAVFGGIGDLLVLGPAISDPEQSSSGCPPSSTSHNLRIARFQGKERLLMYEMGPDGEPTEYYRR
ncbi:hypothetical protein ACWGI0_06965 [Streptomyces sp. NPDC054802]